MCRHLAYLGPEICLEALLVTPPHSLLHQARSARYQTSGNGNPDGYGVGWYAPDGTVNRYRTTLPIWQDSHLDRMSRNVKAGAVLAAVRHASPGSRVEVTGNAPFTAGPWLFSLNGVVDGFHWGVGDELRALGSQRRLEAIEGITDSELLFALVLDGIDAGATPSEALASTVGEVMIRSTGRLNMLLTDGHSIAATAWSNSLFMRADDALIVASEPLDDDEGWNRVPDRTLVTATLDAIELTPLEIGAP